MSTDPSPSVNPEQPGAHFQVTAKQLPLSCPMPEMALWNQHPRVYLAVEKSGDVACPYCGTRYTLSAVD